MTDMTALRASLSHLHRASETQLISDLVVQAGFRAEQRNRIVAQAKSWVEDVREAGKPSLMEVFLEEYGLSSEEGLALMCLAESLLRVPDSETVDSLIADKIVPSAWEEHLGRSNSALVNASTWGLILTSRVLGDAGEAGVTEQGALGILQMAVRRVGEPVIRAAVQRAMKELGAQFVLGQTIHEASDKARSLEKQGYTYSYDMLGEAALTQADADAYFDKYKEAILVITENCHAEDPRLNPGISIKLSALHPRFEVAQYDRVMDELVPRVTELAHLAAQGCMGLNVDAEEAARLDISLDVIEAVISDTNLPDWDGFGVVVQAYGKRASAVIDWLYDLSERTQRKLMVRLVKGAYWDTEIKLAQIDGVEDFPVFSTKAATDISYMCCAKSLLEKKDRLYPQFATHNAHTLATVMELAGEWVDQFEFQRLHGMGGALHKQVKDDSQARSRPTRCRIYAPVGMHRDLLAYLVRRLLENGANSSFVNQIVDMDIPSDEIARDPFLWLDEGMPTSDSVLLPSRLYAPARANSKGWDINNRADMAAIEAARAPYLTGKWVAQPTSVKDIKGRTLLDITNPFDPTDHVGTVTKATPEDVKRAVKRATRWEGVTAQERADILTKASDLYEAHYGEFFALLCREAGKVLPDAIGELREAVDFLRYYGAESLKVPTAKAQGCFTCISPWNFPLAIFTGQIAAALAAGNAVLAKPAESTPLVAALAVNLLHQAGVPKTVLQLLPGTGPVVGAVLTSEPKVNGVCFTGSIQTAQHIHVSMAKHLASPAPLIAETGGLNAMIVDSTALPEQAVHDIITSAFQSAGQRCSALRVLYVQEDIAAPFQDMLFGAMDELQLGNPWHLSTDIGPVIDARAQKAIADYIEQARTEGRLVKALTTPDTGYFIGPSVIKVSGIHDLKKEVFGPVLHIATFKVGELDQVVFDINASGYGLTFGLHSRISARVDRLKTQIHAGNIYVNRNQIGATVGSQPFGGEGLSGTGPKAGGPHYLERFRAQVRLDRPDFAQHSVSNGTDVQTLIDKVKAPKLLDQTPLDMPGPTGESNQLSLYPRGTVLCLGPTEQEARAQVAIARARSCAAVAVAQNYTDKDGINGYLEPSLLATLQGFTCVCFWGETSRARDYRQALARRSGPIIPLVTTQNLGAYCSHERHVCIDTTAAGGNAQLLAGLA